ncbi:sarcosine oxidase subunit gamma [Cognatiyoonia sediminum]|uniref:Sarcosine oxidase subunit gamma n=1 Tax=Cognatiyoonia sediminum TaxID=1508389 RepID=A0A1M5L769_9RHOB|nr:sarcosine oxidase subunit gamma [Cognatiyoonia sediminum]SHG60887.1 sarcosine oxidase subunit gamma [Cognatiyoonia sediminum]
MHSLSPITALGGQTPKITTIGSINVSEIDSLALASIATRKGGKTVTEKVLKSMIGSVPAVGKTCSKGSFSGFWMGPDQWMITAPLETHETIADDLVAAVVSKASVTEQTGAWAIFDISGAAMPDVCERLCAVPIREMNVGDVCRTSIHQLGCFVTPMNSGNTLRVVGPRASARSLYHAIEVAAKSVA